MREAAMASLLRPPVMFERALNAFWILLGAAAAAYAWTLGLIGASGPESGLFPFLAGLIIMGAGVVLLLRSASENTAPDFPRGDALWRVLGVIAGLAFHGDQHPVSGVCGCRFHNDGHPAAHRGKIQLVVLARACLG